MHLRHRFVVLLFTLASAGVGCANTPTPAGEGEACAYAAETPSASCKPELYCHPTRDADGVLVLKANGLDKKSAVGTCTKKVAANATCTQDSTCVAGHTCGFEDPAHDEGQCLPEAPGPR